MELVKLFQPFLIASLVGSFGLLTLIHIAEKPMRGILLFLTAFYLFPSSMFLSSLSWWVLIVILFLTFFAIYTRQLALPIVDRKFPKIAFAPIIFIILLTTSIILASWDQLANPMFWHLSLDAMTFVARSYYFAYFTGFLIIIIVPMALQTERQFTQFMNLLIALGLFIAIWGIAEQITGIEFFADLRGGLVSNPSRLSTLPHGSVTSSAAFLMLPGFYGLYKLIFDKQSRSFLLTLSTIIIIIAFLWTFTRAAYLGVITSVGILAFISPISMRLKTIVIILGIVALLLIYISGFRFPTSSNTLLANPYLSWMLENSYIESREDETFNPLDATDLSGRLKRWELALITMSDNPIIGTGLGTNVREVDKRRSLGLAGAVGRMLSSNHNSFLDLGIDLGIVGVSIIGLMMTQTLLNFKLAFFKASKNNLSSLKINAIILASLLPALIVHYSFNSDRGLPFIFLFFGLSLSLLHIAESNNQADF
jgi:O-antigen ligase